VKLLGFTDIKSQAEEIVSKLSLEEKALLCSGADFSHIEPMPDYELGSVTVADGSHGVLTLDGKECRSTCFPSPSALACSFDRTLVSDVAGAIGREASEKGVSLLLAPSLSIKRNPIGGRNFEYFSEDPLVAGELGAAYINGLDRTGVEGCLRHFVCGNTENKRYVANSCVDERTLNEIYLEPFRIALKKSQPAAVMTAVNRVNGEYCSESDNLIREKLRDKFGFNGVVMSDFGAVNDRIAALKASLDIEMPGKTSATTEQIIEAVRSGELSESVLDETAKRIVELSISCKRNKKNSGLFSERHPREARIAAGESAVLLKNDGSLPIQKGTRIAVIGASAEKLTIQGDSSQIDCDDVNFVACLKERGFEVSYSAGCNDDGTTNDMMIREARETARGGDITVVVINLPYGEQTEGVDRSSLSLPDGVLKLVDQLLLDDIRVSVLLCVGSPVELPFERRVSSILLMGLAGEAAGEAAADILTGRVIPSGKLAETWPRRLNNVPANAYYNKNRKNSEYREGVWVGYRYFDAAGVDPLFPFGYGLSYTTFEYLGISLGYGSRKGTLCATVGVRNTGALCGAEVVQLYVGKTKSDQKQLKGFEKVILLPGQTTFLKFELTMMDFSVYARDGIWHVDPDEYYIMAASSSRDIRAVARVSVEGDELHGFVETDPKKAASVSDAEFEKLLGELPKEMPHRPFTGNSTLSELKPSFIGRVMYAVAEATAKINGDIGFPQADMPLRVLCSLSGGSLSNRRVRARVLLANGKVFASFGAMFRFDKYTKSPNRKRLDG